MLIVIADDITGAAEIAGIAFARGLDTQLRVVPPGNSGGETATALSSAAVLVLATDTRSMAEDEARNETRRLAIQLRQVMGPGDRLFKKTDSALRGHVIGELQALLEATGRTKAVYLPANPSKGRIIRGGIYYINGTPIAETDFSFDPEFPARTSSLAERFPDAPALGITMPDATTEDDIHRAIGDETAIYAGAADLFAAVLDREQGTGSGKQGARCKGEEAGRRLVLCGSTQSKPLQLGIPESPMPLSLYDGSDDLTPWLTDALPQYEKGDGLILTIPHRHHTGKAVAIHLRQLMARMAGVLVGHHPPYELLIEGGATAFATLQHLGWSNFRIVEQIAPGVVRMQADNQIYVTMKPGSYPWKI